MLSELGAYWYRPRTSLRENDRTRFRLAYSSYLRQMLRSPRYIYQHVGVWNAFRPNSSAAVIGWKDPRTILTLDAWLKAFPTLKLVVIERNPISVAQSLAVRYKRRTENEIKKLKRRTPLYGLVPKRGHVFNGLGLSSIDEGVQLWAQYRSTLDHFLSNADPSNILKIYYEDYLISPTTKLKEVAEFLSLRVPKNLSDVVINVDASRATLDPHKASYSTPTQDILAKYGYH